MKTVIISLICFFSLGFINCASGQNQQKSKIEKQVDSIFHLMIKAAQHRVYIMRVSEQFASSELAGKGSNGG